MNEDPLHIPSTAIGQSSVAELQEHKRGSLQQAISLAMQTVRDPDAFQDPDPDPYGYGQEMEHEFGLDLLTPNWKAKPDDPLWNKRFLARARKAAVARLYLQGKSIKDIADSCKVSQVTVYKDIANISLEWRKSYMEDIEKLASRDLARLDMMFASLADAMERGDTKAIEAGIKIIDARGNILGYRAGVQVDIEQYIRQVASANGYDPDRAVNIAQRIKVTMR